LPTPLAPRLRANNALLVTFTCAARFTAFAQRLDARVYGTLLDRANHRTLRDSSLLRWKKRAVFRHKRSTHALFTDSAQLRTPARIPRYTHPVTFGLRHVLRSLNSATLVGAGRSFALVLRLPRSRCSDSVLRVARFCAFSIQFCGFASPRVATRSSPISWCRYLCCPRALDTTGSTVISTILVGLRL